MADETGTMPVPIKKVFQLPDWLTSVRSLVTLMIAASYCYLAIIDKVKGPDVQSVVMMVLGFYFVTKDRNEVKP